MQPRTRLLTFRTVTCGVAAFSFLCATALGQQPPSPDNNLPPAPAPAPAPTPRPPPPPQPQQAIFAVTTDGFKENTIVFTFKTALPTVAVVKISRHPPVNNAFQTILSRGVSSMPLKSHRIEVRGVGSKPRETFYYVISAGAVRKTGTCHSNTRID